MQRLIDESRLQCELAFIPMEQRTFRKAVETAEEAETVLTIPDNPTNGDMIKVIFPTIESRLDERTGIMLVKWTDGTTKTFKADWWNAPYKMES